MFFFNNIKTNISIKNKLNHLICFLSTFFYKRLFITQIITPDLNELSLYANQGFSGDDIIWLHFKETSDILFLYHLIEISWFTNAFYNTSEISTIFNTLYNLIFIDYYVESSYIFMILIILFNLILYTKKDNLTEYVLTTKNIILANIIITFSSIFVLLNVYIEKFKINFLEKLNIFNDFDQFYFFKRLDLHSDIFILNKPSKLIFNHLFILDDFVFVMKLFLLLCFLFFNIVIYLLFFNFFKGIFIKLNLNSYYLQLNILNLQFLRNFILFSNFVIFFLLNLISSYNLLSLFVSLEGATLCLYVLAGLKTTNRLSIEAGLKYFLTSSVFSCLFGMGLFLIYFTTGSTDFYEIRESILLLINLTELSYFVDSVLSFDTNLIYSSDNVNFIMLFLLNIGIFLIFFVFLMKLGAVPYHFWIGDVYQGSPLIVTSFFATVVRIGMFAIFFRLIAQVFFFAPQLSTILYFFGFLSIIYGGLHSLAQFEIKRFLAYSSIVHTGFILLGLSTLTFEGFKASFFYLVIYIFTLLSFFLILLLTQNIFQSFDKKKDSYIVRDYKYFSDLCSLPLSLQMYSIFLLFSMAGLPPFPGFLIKLYVLKIFFYEFFFNIRLFLDTQNLTFNTFIFLLMFVSIILISFLTGYNYIRIVNKMSFSLNKYFLEFTKFNYIFYFKKYYFILIYFFVFFHIFLIFFASYFYVTKNNLIYIFIESLRHPFFHWDIIKNVISNIALIKPIPSFENEVSSFNSFYNWFWNYYKTINIPQKNSFYEYATFKGSLNYWTNTLCTSYDVIRISHEYFAFLNSTKN